ncbi:uncharacterized protein LOC144245754 isoform X1 [Crocuta crocuta]
MPLPHFIWLPSSAGNLPPRCKENAAGTEENSVLALPNNPPPSPATAGHCSCLLCPAGVSRSQTAPFSSQPAQEPRCRLIGSARRESRPGLGVPRSGSRRAAAAEVNGARVGEGGWGAGLPLPASSSSRGGSGASRARRVLGSRSPGCARGAREIASPGCGRRRKPLPRSLARSLARAPGAAALAKTHRRENGARSQKLVMSSVQREPHPLFF